jgi:hypothetical protein
MSVALLTATALVTGGCSGGGEGHATTSRVRISTSSAPSFETAKRACGSTGSNALARTLGVSTSDPATLAKAYAERKAPPALREQAFKGCYAGLVK